MKDTINNIWIKCKKIVDVVERHDVFMALLILGVAIGSFGFGFLAGDSRGRAPMTITSQAHDFSGITTGAAVGAAGGESATEGITPRVSGFVASKNGTAYHYPWCSGAARIKEENKIWFETRETAEAAGYSAAKNCNGL